MNTTSNIAAMQTSGVTNTPKSQSLGQSSQGLLGFLDTLIQQIQATAQGGGTPAAAQNAPLDFKSLTEKIAALLKKDGMTAADLQNMSPADLAAKIAAMLQQQNVSLPASLQNMLPSDLANKIAALIQKNGADATATTAIKPSLTSDLIAQQSSNVQDVQTKEQVAKKIASMLEQQQQSGATALTPIQLQQLKDQIAQLQSAPGTISADTMNQLKTDLTSFLTAQGVSQPTIAGFMADLTQTLQNNQAAASTTVPATQTTGQQSQTNTATTPVATQNAAAQSTNPTAPAPQITDTWLNSSGKVVLPKSTATQIGGKDAAAAANTLPQQAANAGQQPQPAGPLPTPSAKISGLSVNPALINALANNNGGNSNSGGFGSQGGNTPQQQFDLTGSAALLQPASADTLNNQNFTNYLNTSPSQASATTQMINIQMQRNIGDGMNSMTLQLEPAELGKLNVKLNFAKDGSVKAHMTVDKPETLALLQKDSIHLQRALQQSGVDVDENSLSFDLRQQGQQQNLNGSNGGGNHANDFSSGLDSSTDNAIQAQIAIQASGYITQSGVNIMV